MALPAHVERLCSVSNCINGPGREWINLRWHNDWGYFDCPRDAWSIVEGLPDAREFRLFAYRMLLAYFTSEGPPRPIELAPDEPPVEPLDDSFREVGFDVVSRDRSSFFECSPLSCNYMAGEVTGVNEHCLLTTQGVAVEFATRCAKEQPEPGYYYVLQVFEQQPA